MANRVAATGVLLVGGASERFGSPKALARFRGETLAERAWRTLGDVCAEVLAVGKAADELELPFEVLDDGASGRAPVFGVLAGLRAAAHDTCLLLPVDVPLVTPDLLRTLLESRATPQTGPLPGVYTKATIPVLEERIAKGELSLWGVSTAVAEVDAKLLLNANTEMDILLAAVADWARSREDVRAVVVVGSQARSQTPADAHSDLDALLFVDEPELLAADRSWVGEIGRAVLTFLEPTGLGDRVECRVLFDSGQQADFPLLGAATWRDVVASPGAAAVVARGTRVLYDELGVEVELAGLTPPVEAQLDAEALTELASDFWFHALWTARKLRRGEVFTAIECLDGYMKARLASLLALHARSLDPDVDTWHAGRFLERWADPGALVALEWAYARYSVRDVARALWETIDLFQGLEEETTRRLGLSAGLDHADLRRRVSEVVPDPRRGSTLSS